MQEETKEKTSRKQEEMKKTSTRNVQKMVKSVVKTPGITR